MLIRTFLRIFFAAVILLTAARPCHTQGSARHQLGQETWNFRIGYVFPSEDTVDDSEVMIGIEKEFLAADGIEALEADTFTLTVDWTRITRRDPSTGEIRNVNLFPILMNLKTHKAMEQDGPYWDIGVGLGLYWSMDDIPEMKLKEGTRFAWQVIADYHFSPTWFLSARYIAGSHPNHDRLLGVQFGYKF